MCVGEPVCRHVRMCVQCLQRSEEGMVAPGEGSCPTPEIGAKN